MNQENRGLQVILYQLTGEQNTKFILGWYITAIY